MNLTENFLKTGISFTEDADGKLFMTGKVQSTKVNGNGRRYSEELWDKLHEGDDFQRRLNDGLLLGSIGHPQDGHYDPEKSAIVVREHKRDGDSVYAKFEVLDTPSGNILKTLHKAGVKMGVSSRGKGDSQTVEGVQEIVPGTFILEGYDTVIDPSVGDARPQYHTESLRKFKTLVEERLDDKDISEEETVGYKAIMESLDVEKALTEDKLDDGDSSFLEFNTKLNSKMKSFINPKKMPDFKEELKVAQEEKETLIQEKTKLEGEHSSLQEKHDALKKIAEASQDKVSNLEEQINDKDTELSNKTERYEALSKLTKEAIKQRNEANDNVATLESKVEGLTKIVESYLKKEDADKSANLNAKVESITAKFPENLQESVKVVLATAKSPKELATVAESLAKMHDVEDVTLPKKGEPKKETKVEKKDDKSKDNVMEGLDPIVQSMLRKQAEAEKRLQS